MYSYYVCVCVFQTFILNINLTLDTIFTNRYYTQ